MSHMELCLGHDGVGVAEAAGHHELDGCVDLPAELKVGSALICLAHKVQVPLRDPPQISITTCNRLQLPFKTCQP